MLAQQLSSVADNRTVLRQVLEKNFLSGIQLYDIGWDNLQEQIIRASTIEHEDNKPEQAEDDISLGSSSSEEDNGKADKKQSERRHC
jgi:hypothetical protein